ncbi:MAG: hypothetical protein QXI12_02590 [Candidatus Methanomethyliaceae archaeon]
MQSRTSPLEAVVRHASFAYLSILFLVLAFLTALFLMGINGFGFADVLHVGAFDIAVISLGIWLTAVTVWWVRRQGRLDPFEIPVWFSLNVYGQVVFNVWLFQRNQVPAIPWLYDAYEPKMALAVLLMGVGLTSLWAGYVWASRRMGRLQRPVASITGPIRAPVAVVIWLLCTLAGVWAQISGVYGYLAPVSNWEWQRYIVLVDSVGWVAFAALSLHHFSRPTLIGWMWLVTAATSAVALDLVSARRTLAMTFIWLVLFVYYATRKLPWRWLAIGALLVFLLLPTVNAIRWNLSTQNRDGSLLVRLGTVIQSLQEVVTSPLSDLLDETILTFQNRQGGLLYITASVMTIHPTQVPFVSAEMLQYLSIQLIPRVIWPGKPAGQPNLYMITTTYWGGLEEYYRFSAIGQFADSYRVGGWVFVLLWFIALGALSAWLYYQGPGRNNLAGTVFYFFILSRVITYDNNIASLTLDLLQAAPLIWILTTFVMFSPRRASVRHRRSLLAENRAWLVLQHYEK